MKDISDSNGFCGQAIFMCRLTGYIASVANCIYCLIPLTVQSDRALDGPIGSP
jgi:hypothetical protein